MSEQQQTEGDETRRRRTMSDGWQATEARGGPSGRENTEARAKRQRKGGQQAVSTRS